MIMNSHSSNESSTAYGDVDLILLRLWEASNPERDLKVNLKDTSLSPPDSPSTTLRSCISQGDQPAGTGTRKSETRTSQSPLLAVSIPIAANADPVYADRQSGVIFTSGLIRASGERVKVREFCKARGLAPTLRLVIPLAPDSAVVAPTIATDAKQQRPSPLNGSRISRPTPTLPSFSLTLASPTTTLQSPIHYPTSVHTTFTRLSYLKEASRAPRHTRIPYLPQYCAHTLLPFVPLTKCALCEIQILACETWWNFRNPTASGLKRSLQVPQVLPADCTQTSRSIHYALGLPLGELDESCIDWDIIDAIMFIPSRPLRRRRDRQLLMTIFREPSSSSSRSRVRVLIRRAHRFFSTF